MAWVKRDKNLVITFDENSRRDYITGFRKRKQERAKLGREKAINILKKEKAESRKEKKRKLHEVDEQLESIEAIANGKKEAASVSIPDDLDSVCSSEECEGDINLEKSDILIEEDDSLTTVTITDLNDDFEALDEMNNEIARKRKRDLENSLGTSEVLENYKKMQKEKVVLKKPKVKKSKQRPRQGKLLDSQGRRNNPKGKVGREKLKRNRKP
ncbi:hypothetical protein HDU92_008167 [Lobulomyces angularis]|nr:hypothetical protein HDU92_008167 [Lobulomyces angularis]